MFFHRFAGIVAAVVLLYVNLEVWHLFWLGWLVLPLYIWLVSEGFENFVSNHFNFIAGARTKAIGALLAIASVGALCGVAIIFWKLSALAIAVILLLVGIIAVLMQSIKLAHPATETPDGEEQVIEIKQSRFYVIAYLVFVALGFYFLWSARSADSLITPWQIIPRHYIYVYFLATLTLGGLLFSKFKTGALLTILVIQSLVMFSYLPLTHKLFWGADGWRHLASMNQVIAEEPLDIRNFSAGDNWAEKLNPGRFSYSQFWGTEVLFGRVLDIDLIFVMSWLLPVLAGIFLPVLLYEIGAAMGFGRRKSLLLPWLGLWPFAFQAAGAFTLPVNFGFLFFLAVLLLILKRLESPKKIQIWLLLALFVLSIFGYALYLILFALVWAGAEILLRQKSAEPKTPSKSAIVLICIISFFTLPAIELVAGYARIGPIDFIGEVKQLIGNFSGYYLAAGPQPHLIETGNIFFNQTPSYAFVPNGFTVWRWWIPVFMILVLVAMFFGVRALWRKRDKASRLMVILGVSLFAGYVLSRYFLVGDHLIFRRTEILIAFFAIIFLFAAFEKAFSRNQFATMLIILVFSIAAVASYTLGPVSRAMSLTEYNKAGQVWSEIKNEDKYCVVGDVYPLLALEAISGKIVVGGGFPIDKDFGQPELVALYNDFKNGESDALWQKARELTGARKCYLIVDDKIISKEF